MQTQKNIFCIIPAYNEEKRIIKTINDVKKYINNIVVIDDCSTDKTYKLAKQQNITVLKHIINRDQGAALQTGNEYALKNNADIIVHFDADGQFLASEINDMIKPIINENYDVVLGSRFLGKKSNMPWFKKNIIFPLARIVNKIFFNINLTDPQSGFRALSKNALKKIKIEQDGKAHCSEILHKIFKYNLKVKEVPITVVYHHFGQKFSGGITIIKDIIFAKLLN